MLRKLIFISLIVPGLSWAQDNNLAFNFLEHLPENIQKIMTTNPSKENIANIMGKADLKKENQLLYEIDQYRFRLILSYDKNQMTSLRYVLSHPIPMEQFLSANIFKADDLNYYPEKGKSKGRYLSTTIPFDRGGELHLFFYNSSHHGLHSIIWETASP